MVFARDIFARGLSLDLCEPSPVGVDPRELVKDEVFQGFVLDMVGRFDFDLSVGRMDREVRTLDFLFVDLYVKVFYAPCGGGFRRMHRGFVQGQRYGM